MKKTILLSLTLCLFGIQSSFALDFIEPPQWVKDKVHNNISGQPAGTRHITKCVMYRGLFAIASTDNVPDSEYDKAVEIVEQMIGHDPYNIFQQLFDIGHVMLLFNGADNGPNEKVSDFGCYASTGADNYGYGGNPNTSGGTVSSLNIENFGWREGNGLYREDIFMHEFAHGIHLCGLAHTDFNSRVQAHFNARGRALWANTYAATDHKEYWAEISQSYFDANPETPNAYHNAVNTREELLAHDPTGYDLCEEIYGRPNSVGSVDGLKPFDIYPNPTKDILKMPIDDQKYEVVDMTGRSILEFENKTGRLDVADLRSGMYFIRSRKTGSAVRFVKK